MTQHRDVGAEAIQEHSNGPPEKDLAAAILHLALADLEDPQRLRSGDSLEVLQEARDFCFSSDPHWRWSRETWCELADVDVGFFQRQAIARVRGG